ncbi:alpha/beta fold hydrolase [Solicola gregarius]|uniref:Alpha/beta fold hydrolase n=1 Tax=Solicola gregarius TaxID=2908642 RepID=A0AA46TKZ1_9ACTN|nr:alpha/beta hydrolase [Solicola gregarius]UYM06827.1 alpha/beta fold hydrolase [Solicola gregarius]
MVETMVQLRGVEICVDTFGDRDAPAMLLISGAAGSMDGWDPDFCRALGEAGRFVIRYDHRDTGRSTSSPPGEPTYTGDDLTRDPIALIDEVAGGTAHVVGISMGGGIAQYIAAYAPERVTTLTLMSTSIAGTPSTQRDLPSMAPRARESFENPPPEPDWSDRAAVIDYLVEAERPLAAPGEFDEAYARAVAARTVDRTTRIESATKNHWLDLGDSEYDSPPMRNVLAPTLVIHGREDPMFPPEHGEALAAEIDGAELLIVDGMGHQVPPRSTWDLVVPAIVRHTDPRRP